MSDEIIVVMHKSKYNLTATIIVVVFSTMSSSKESDEGKSSRIGVRLTTEQDLALQAIADLRFGGNRTSAIIAGMGLARLVYGDVSTFYARTPAEALRAYVEEQKNS